MAVVNIQANLKHEIQNCSWNWNLATVYLKRKSFREENHYLRLYLSFYKLVGYFFQTFDHKKPSYLYFRENIRNNNRAECLGKTFVNYQPWCDQNSFCDSLFFRMASSDFPDLSFLKRFAKENLSSHLHFVSSFFTFYLF